MVVVTVGHSHGSESPRNNYECRRGREIVWRGSARTWKSRRRGDTQADSGCDLVQNHNTNCTREMRKTAAALANRPPKIVLRVGAIRNPAAAMRLEKKTATSGKYS